MSGSKTARADALLIATAFVLSGAASLTYEIVWVRMLSTIFGNTTHAVATVLAAFMGGLALGSGSFAHLLSRRPTLGLRAYGLLEAAVGVYGLLVPAIFAGIEWLDSSALGSADGGGRFRLAGVFLLSFVAIALPTALMGGTLPLLTHACTSRLGELGGSLGRLYALNTFGAVCGTVLSGFFLVPSLGLTGTTRLAAFANFAVAAVVLVRSRFASPASPTEEAPAAPEEERARVSSPRVLLACMAVSGACAMVLENAWTRALTLVIGMSCYSFTIMLATFLVGLALGSAAIGRISRTRQLGASALTLLQLACAACTLASIPLFEKLPFVFMRLRHGLSGSFEQTLAIQAVLCFLVMLGPTFFMGAVFPLAARLYTTSARGIGASVGVAYAWNTIGSIAGALLGGFVLIPGLGIQRTLIFAVLVFAVLGVAFAAIDTAARSWQRVAGQVGLVFVTTATLFGVGTWDPAIMVSGTNLYYDWFRDLPTDALRRDGMRMSEVLYYREGVTATISVQRFADGNICLRTNGKSEAGVNAVDRYPRLLVGYLPLLARPTARRALLIGLGGGATLKALSQFPLESIDVAEIEPAVVETLPFFAGKNGDLEGDDRIRFVADDGRCFLRRSSGGYDAIVVEASNPWIAGIGSLFTEEFYRSALAKLSEDGVFCQWIQAYALPPAELRLIYRTFAAAFPDVALWTLNSNDFVLMGSRRSLAPRSGSWRDTFARSPDVRQGLDELGFTDPRSLLPLYRMPRGPLLELAQAGSLHTDDVPRLEYAAPRYLSVETRPINGALVDRHALTPQVADPDAAAVAPETSRSLALALAHGYFAQNNNARALGLVEEALVATPGDPEALLLRGRIRLELGELEGAGQDLLASAEGGVDAIAPLTRAAERLPADRAAPILSRVVTQAPAFTPARYALAHALYFSGDVAGSESLYRSLRPEGLAYAGLARIELGRGGLDEAIAAVEAALERGERSGELLAMKGEALARKGAYAEAADAYRRSLGFDVRNTWWRLGLARALARVPAEREAAAAALRDVLRLEPSNLEAWDELEKLGQTF